MIEKNKLIEHISYDWSPDSIRLFSTPSPAAKAAYFYTQELGYFKTTYPYFAERQNLNSFLIVYTISGIGYLEYESKTYSLSGGTCFFIHCEQYHRYWTSKEHEWEFLWFHFHGNSALGYYKEFAKNGFEPLLCNDTFLWESTIWRMIALNQKKDLTTEPLTAQLIHTLLTELLVQTATNNKVTFLIPDYIRAIAKDIDQNFRSPLPLSYFESHYHRSKYHLIREFKKYIGVTLNEYIIGTRLAHAKELLKYSDYSISEIAYDTGFHNVTHFINLFKKREDMTPLVYRKAWKS